MWILVIIVILFIWLLKNIFVGKPDSELAKSRKGKLYFACRYFGGFDDVSVKRNDVVDVVFNDNYIDFNFHKGWEIQKTKRIDYTDIAKVKFMNETTISQEISIGKMICFGWLSLAMKNEKKHVVEYVVIDVNYEKEISSIVLLASLNGDERLLNEIKNRINSHN